MTLPELCIRRPVMTTLLAAALVFFGLAAYLSLPVSELPAVDFPTIQVSANLSGADPETMASAVALPLERQFSTIAGVTSMTSSSGQGVSKITLQFALDRNIDAAALDVQSAISAALGNLPSDMSTPPSFRKVNPAELPILYLALSSADLPLWVVDEYAENMLAQKLSTIAGVAEVLVFGPQKFAVRVQVDPDALEARGIGIDEVASAVEAANVNLPTGNLQGPNQVFAVRATGQLTNATQYLSQIVTFRNGAPLYLKGLGRIINSVENDTVAGWYNNTRAVVLAVKRQPGSNTIQIVDAIRKVLPTFREQLPASIHFDELFDRSQSIRASVRDVQFTLLLAGLLVILVIFLFLRRAAATAIAGISLPISTIGAFAGMYLLGFSLDTLSLLALTLSVGFVVDDAIVMLENIVRHHDAGETTMAAALRGSREIAFTILSMTASLVAVFIPLLFMSGIVGRLLNEFAVTVVLAIAVSGLLSLTLTPMMCSRFLKRETESASGALQRLSERSFARVLAGYERSLAWCLARRPAVLAVFVLTLVASGYLFTRIPKDFLPSQDIDQIYAFTQGGQDYSFDAMVRHQQEAVKILQADPNVAATMSSVGVSGSHLTYNSGFVFVRLKPASERALSANQVIQSLRPKLATLTGINVYLQNPPPIRIGAVVSNAQYQYAMQDLNLDRLYASADTFSHALAKTPGFQDVTTDMNLASPTLQVEIDRDKAARLGVTVDQIETALGSAYGSQQVSTIYTPADQYQVILEVAPEYRSGPSALNKLYIRSANGKLVPLSALATIKRTVGPLTVSHLGQLPAVTVTFNLAPGVTLGDAVSAIEQLKRDLKLPASLTTGFQGAAQAFQESLRGLGFLLLIAVLVVYIVLGVLYESYIHPLTILSGLPSAGLGALIALMLLGMPMNLYGFVGIIMLIGIVKKNAIMMIDFALVAERSGEKSAEQAIQEACLIRFRPIMMTTMAALLATLPVALGFGAGGEARQPLGVSVVGGLLVSQLLTLYLTPVIYIYLDRLQGLRFRKAVPST
jgi:HAE1 family hydrophobic/amphiphilic exporter-1